MTDSNMFSLNGKVALVTGGSRGIGKAAAIGLAKAGADVAVASRKLPDLMAVAGEIKAMGRRSLAIEAHLGRMDQVRGLANQVVAEFGAIDILVNNAGVNPVMAPAIDLEERAWDVVMNLNLKGLFFLSQAVARVMKERGGGAIVNIASVNGFSPEPKISAYSISKAGVIMATKAMALEWAAHNIRVNAVAPALFHSRMLDARLAEAPAEAEELLKRVPTRRFAGLDEIVGTILYLASDASSYTTGHTIIADGGYLLVTPGAPDFPAPIR